jgi:hypothetical protein
MRKGGKTQQDAGAPRPKAAGRMSVYSSATLLARAVLMEVDWIISQDLLAEVPIS